MSYSVTAKWEDAEGREYRIHAKVTLDDREGSDDVDVWDVTTAYGDPIPGETNEFCQRKDVDAAWSLIRERLVEAAIEDRENDRYTAAAERGMDE